MVVEKVFAVIAESTRRDILEALAQESKAVGQLVDELGVSQPTVSKHLRVLREAGVVTMRAQGQKRFYGINTEPLVLVSTWLESLGAGHAGSGGAAVGTNGAAGAAGAAKIRRDGPEPKAAQGASLTAEPAAVAVQRSPAARPKHETAPAATEPDVPAVAVPSARAASGPAAASVAAAAREAHPAELARIAAGKSAGSAATRLVPQPQPVGIDNDGGVPRQLGRSVGRAAKKGADLLATFKRRKD